MADSGNIPNLWPETINIDNSIIPIAVLTKQAQVISEKTRERLQGKVETKVLGRDFNHTLYLSAPKLDNFTQFIIRVRHAIDHSYPVYVYLSEQSDTSKECVDEEALYDILRQRLRSEQIVGLIQSLLAQSQSL